MTIEMSKKDMEAIMTSTEIPQVELDFRRDHVDAISHGLDERAKPVVLIDVGDLPPDQALAYVGDVRRAYRIPGAVIPDRPPRRPFLLAFPIRVAVTIFGAIAVVVGFLWSLLR